MLGQPRRHFAETDSTNRVALDWADAPHGALVSADAQTAGRGRRGRSWSSPAGAGLYCSLVLRTDATALALKAGLAVARATEKVCGLPIGCKWPNDILCDGRKIGGILCEARDERIVVGIGLNLTQRGEDLPSRPLFPASSLLLESGRSWAPDELLAPILRALQAVLDDENWRADYENRMFGRGEVARVDGTTGVIAGIAGDGSLRLQTADGPRAIVAGDVEFV